MTDNTSNGEWNPQALNLVLDPSPREDLPRQTAEGTHMTP